MAVRKILVPLSGAETEAAVLGTAMTVAKTFNAQLVGLFVRPDPTEALPYLGDGVSGQVIEQLMQAAKSGSDQASDKARTMFTDAASKAGLPMAPKDGGNTPLPSVRFLDVAGHRDDVVAAHSRLSDIVVFGEGNGSRDDERGASCADRAQGLRYSCGWHSCYRLGRKPDGGARCHSRHSFSRNGKERHDIVHWQSW